MSETQSIGSEIQTFAGPGTVVSVGINHKTNERTYCVRLFVPMKSETGRTYTMVWVKES